MIYTVETKDLSNRIFETNPFGCWLTDEVKAWCETHGLTHVALPGRGPRHSLELDSTSIVWTDDMLTVGDNELVTSTFYFGDPEVAMLFRLTWA